MGSPPQAHCFLPQNLPKRPGEGVPVNRPTARFLLTRRPTLPPAPLAWNPAVSPPSSDDNPRYSSSPPSPPLRGWPAVRPRAGGSRRIREPRRLRTAENDLPVSEDSYQLQITPKRGKVALKRRHLVLTETLSALQSRDVGLVDVGRFPDLDLGLPHSLAQSSKREMNPAPRPQASPQDPHRIRVGLGSSPRCLAHTEPPVS